MTESPTTKRVKEYLRRSWGALEDPDHLEQLDQLAREVSATPAPKEVLDALEWHRGTNPVLVSGRRSILRAAVSNPNLTEHDLRTIASTHSDALHPEVLADLLERPEVTRKVLAWLHAMELDQLVVNAETRALLDAADPDLHRVVRACDRAGWGSWGRLVTAALFLADHDDATLEIFLGLQWNWKGSLESSLEAAASLAGSAPQQ